MRKRSTVDDLACDPLASRPTGRAASPSAFVVRWLERAPADGTRPRALDVPAGYGRHAFAAVAGGYDVTAIDISGRRITELAAMAERLGVSDRISLIVADLQNVDYAALGPFELMIVTDFNDTGVLARAPQCLRSRGVLIFESPGAHGGNWLDLPRSGTVSALCEDEFDVLAYEERRAGPPAADRVTVKCAARRR